MINRLKRFSSALLRDEGGVSLTEFAVVAPVFITMGLFGLEVSHIATTKMKVSQIALSLADNASRLGQNDNSAIIPTISEDDVDAVLEGALIQGRSVNLETNARVILSSLEVDPPTGRQFIHWQRCIGELDRDSAYGDDDTNNGLSGSTIAGMGNGANLVTAPAGSAVMYVEIHYEYDSIIPNPYVEDMGFREEAAFLVRDDRTLQDSTDPGLVGTPQNDCST
ncbi:TadE/TadG family type IV pilus assembly protein [Erythrobacter sp. W53]|uniref:TadE/TadG family type IV pilus assembly protein n=1 Tax=Erythrobacteraceae TaxID=335929 RepID=UPI0036D3357D